MARHTRFNPMKLQSAALPVLLALLCLLSPVSARPGVRPAQLRPTLQDLLASAVPEGAVVLPPPERSSVEAVPIASLLPLLDTPAAAVVTPGEPLPADAAQPIAPGAEPTAPVAAAGTQTCIENNIMPLRKQWNSRNGYCGEMSLQMSVMMRGVYISQKTARTEGTRYTPTTYPDLLFDPRNQPTTQMSGVFGVAKMLGLYQPQESYWYMDNQTVALNSNSQKYLTPLPSSFAQWMKQNVAAGRPVIGGYRISGGTYEDYDHIMPVFQVCYTSLGTLASDDSFKMTTNYLANVTRRPSDATFYAPYRGCSYTGCIPSDYQDMAVAVGPLDVPSGVYFPVKLVITRWSDNTATTYEPGEYSTTSATAKYTATVSGLTVGQSYRLYRTTGFFTNWRIPQSAADLATTCTAQGSSNCKSITFSATATSMTFTQDSKGTGTVALGQFKATGVSYFLVVRA